MSVKPDDIPQWAWEKAERAGENIYGRHERGFVMWPLISERGNPTHEIIARAIMAAVEEEREACAALADVYAEVNWQECSDNILLDPVLSNRGARPLTKQDWDKAEDMAVNSTIHSSMYHAAQNIAASIRKRQSKDG